MYNIYMYSNETCVTGGPSRSQGTKWSNNVIKNDIS